MSLNPTNPFQKPAPKYYGIPCVEVCGVPDRIELVRKMDAGQLREVLAMGDLQKTVRLVAAARLRRLEHAELEALKGAGQ